MKDTRLKCVKCGSSWFAAKAFAQYNGEQIFKFHKKPMSVGMTMHLLECLSCHTYNVPDYVYDGFSLDLQKMAKDFMNTLEGKKEEEPQQPIPAPVVSQNS